MNLVWVDFARLPLGPALANQLDLQEREGLDHIHAFRGRAHGSALVGAVQLATAGRVSPKHGAQRHAGVHLCNDKKHIRTKTTLILGKTTKSNSVCVCVGSQRQKKNTSHL
jgi:hypothetical protein